MRAEINGTQGVIAVDKRSTHIYMKGSIKNLVIVAACLSVFVVAAFGQVSDRGKVSAGAERAFARIAPSFSGSAPGCAVGVSLDGVTAFERAFGMAEIEHGVAN